MDVERIEEQELIALTEPGQNGNGSPKGNGDGLMKKPQNVDERKKKGKKITRQNSKEGILGVAGAPNFIAPHRRWKNSRRSRNGVGRGLPKKGGAGGKGVWGKLGSELLEEDVEDQDDPNFDVDAYDNARNVVLKEIVPKMSIEEFTQKTESVLLEYYEHGDTHEVADYLDEFMTNSLRPMIVKVAVEKAMEHKQSHREMTSVLISDLYGKLVTSKDIANGFDILLTNLSDIVLDTPDAAHILGNFIARAVADDCIPPKYVTHPEIDLEDVSDHAVQAIKRADALLSMQHTWAHLDNVWGVSGGLRPVKNITKQMKMLLEEYLLSRDIVEAHRCLQALEVPHFYHELIYEAIIITLEAMNDNTEELICELLKSLDKACIVTRAQLEQGFQRVYDDMSDIVIDMPLAYVILERFVQRCYRAGFTGDNIVKNLPSRGRKRFVSEGDGGHVKPSSMMLRDM